MSKKISKDAQCSQTDFWVREFFCSIFSFLDMVDFEFNIRRELGKEILASLVQKRLPVLPVTLKGEGIQSKSMWGIWAKPRWVAVNFFLS